MSKSYPKKPLVDGFMQSKHPLYTTWASMRHRCYCATCTRWKDYGGRGIKVCARWQGEFGFANFVKDMGSKPGPEYSIDRVDNDGGYSSSNCRWATPKEQASTSRKHNRKRPRKTLNEWINSVIDSCSAY